MTGTDAYLQAACSAALFGTPFKTLADAAREQAAEEAARKVVSFADMRRKLRPPEAGTPFTRSLMATLQSIDDVRNAAPGQKAPIDG